MSAERLLAHYEKIADAPDAISRLRRFILDLAVCGKLAQQEAGDESASELLKRIAKEKARLVQAGQIRKRDESDQVLDNEDAFPLPEKWCWVPATYPAYIVSDLGKKVQTKDVLESGQYPVVDQGKVFIRGYCNDPRKVIQVKSPLILFGDHTRETKLIDFDFVVGADGVKLLQPLCLFARYYFLALTWLPLGSRGYGRHFKLLRLSRIPLPPLAEQHRIVAKVDELMRLCDRLEAARANREAVRDRLAGASLARLNAPASETFQTDARFALEALPALTTRTDQIKTLRQTVLNLAVRGKLVPQDVNDEPAVELLKRIAEEKTRSQKSSTQESMVPNESDGYDSRFVLPSGWAWVSLDQITQVGTGLTPSKTQSGYYEGGDIPWINSSATSGSVISKAEFFVTQLAVKECRLKIYPAGSLVVALYGQGKTRGQVAELGLDATVNQACAVVQWLPSFHELKSFVKLALEQQYDAMRQRAEGGPQPNLNVGKIKSRLFPFPPLSEQRRIVAKVDELMTLCDRLEASLTIAATRRRRLLDALLAEALAPAEDHEMEAAE